MSHKQKGCSGDPVIVVLGGGLTPIGSATTRTQARSLVASQLAKTTRSGEIILSGFRASDDKQLHGQTEAGVMRDILVSLKVRKSRISVENESRDTIGNAVLVAARFLSKREPGTVLVVTSVFHIERARFIFEHVLGPQWQVIMIASPVVSGDTVTALDETKSFARNKDFFGNSVPGDLKAIWHLLVTKHDCYKHLPDAY